MIRTCVISAGQSLYLMVPSPILYDVPFRHNTCVTSTDDDFANNNVIKVVVVVYVVVVVVPVVVAACQCYGHSDECIYNEEVAKNQSSIDIHGEMSGGGVCMNCQHNTVGINCQQCRDGYYRPFNVPLDSPHVCRRTFCC